MRFADEGQSREGLKCSGGGGLRGDGVRDGDCGLCGDGGVFGVGGLPCVDDAGVEGEVGWDVGAEGGDGAGGFAAEDVGGVGEGVDAGAEVAGGRELRVCGGMEGEVPLTYRCNSPQ